MSNLNDHLLPCPFCGGEAILWKMKNIAFNWNRWEVHCSGCGTEKTNYGSPNDAINAWNYRKQMNVKLIDVNTYNQNKTGMGSI